MPLPGTTGSPLAISSAAGQPAAGHIPALAFVSPGCSETACS